MKDILLDIKRAVLTGRVKFTDKAILEMSQDGIDEQDVIEAIANATSVHKKIVSRKRGFREKLYVLLGFASSGVLIYTKGRFHREKGKDVLYILISSKKSAVIPE